MKPMTPAERAITALNGGIPDEVPTFELEFQLPEEFFGISFNDPRFEHLNTLSKGEIERAAIDLADKYARVYTTANAYDIGGAALSGNPEFDSKPGLDYCIIPAYNPFWNDPTHPVTTAFRKRLREYIGTRAFWAATATAPMPSRTATVCTNLRIACMMNRKMCWQ